MTSRKLAEIPAAEWTDRQNVHVVGDFVLDPARGCLLHAGRPVHLRPQAYKALAYLVANRARLVSKDVLIAEIWEGRAVTDDSLVQCLRDVRLALGDGSAQYIRNTRGRGYLFDPEGAPGARDTTPTEDVQTAEPSCRKASSRTHSLLTRHAGHAAASVALIAAGVLFLGSYGVSGVKERSSEKPQLARADPQNARAYQLYLNGIFYARKSGAENTRRALEYYKQSATLDPAFAPTWVGMSNAQRYLAGNGVLDPQHVLRPARLAAEKALALDRNLADVHLVLAGLAKDAWDWAAAEREYKRAIELNPNLESAYTGYSQYLSSMGRHREALTWIERAEQLDPLSVGLRFRKSYAHFVAGHYDQAIDEQLEALGMEPDHPNGNYGLGLMYAANGAYVQAIEAFRRQISATGNSMGLQCYLGYALAMSGNTIEARAQLRALETAKEYVSLAELAALYAGLGDTEAALSALEGAYAAHDPQLQFLKIDPHYARLRSNSRYRALEVKVGLAS